MNRVFRKRRCLFLAQLSSSLATICKSQIFHKMADYYPLTLLPGLQGRSAGNSHELNDVFCLIEAMDFILVYFEISSCTSGV